MRSLLNDFVYLRKCSVLLIASILGQRLQLNIHFLSVFQPLFLNPDGKRDEFKERRIQKNFGKDHCCAERIQINF